MSEDVSPSDAPPCGTAVVLDRELTELLVRLRSADRVLRRLEGRLRSLPEHTSVGIAHVGTDGRIISVTDRFCAIVGYGREELVGRPILEITHPKDQRLEAEQLRRMLAGEMDGYVVEKRCIRRDGGVVWVRMSVTLPRDVMSRPIYQVRVLMDITRQKQVQRARDQARAKVDRQSGLIDARLRGITAGVTVIDAATTAILYYNAAAASMLGLPPRTVGEPVNYPAILEAIDARRLDGTPFPADAEALTRALFVGEPVMGEELIGRRKSGEGVRLGLSTASVKDRRGHVVLAVLAFQDYAASANIDAAIRRLEYEADAARRAKTQFLAVMSHGTRVPLTSIDGFCELLLLGAPEAIGDRARDHVLRIQEAGRDLQHLIEDVLLFARLEAGIRIDLARDRLDAVETARTLVESFAALAKQKKVAIKLHLPDEPVMMETDARRLKTLLVGIISSIVHLGRSGSLSVGIDHAGEMVEFRIRGIGRDIDEGAIDRLSESPWASDRPMSANAPGAGMGLSLARPLSSALGGDLSIECRSGEVVFVYRVPARLCDAEQGPTASLGDPDPSPVAE